MPEVPKIVYERLRSGGEGAHPDSNLLAAFAEQALSAEERENVLQHLARCGDCREAVALSLPALEIIAQQVPEKAVVAVRGLLPRQRMWFTWNRLGWAGLAAGVVIAVGILAIQPGLKKATEAQHKPVIALPSEARSAEVDKTASPPPSSEIATTADNRPEPVAPPPTSLARRDEMKKFAAPAAVVAQKPVAPAQVIGSSAGANVGYELYKNEGQVLDKDVQRQISPVQPGARSESVEVTAEAPLSAESAQATDALAGAQATPVVRAKAARAQAERTEEISTSKADLKQKSNESNLQNLPASGRNLIALEKVAPATAPASPQWALHGDKLQQSVDSGAHWTTVFQRRNLLCVAASGSDVWAGGKRGDLFHSSDSGASWTQVHPSVASQTLDDDVIRIDVSSPTHVVLATSRNESWRTTDGGATWARK